MLQKFKEPKFGIMFLKESFIFQSLGPMARNGHFTGGIFIFVNLWLLFLAIPACI